MTKHSRSQDNFDLMSAPFTTNLERWFEMASQLCNSCENPFKYKCPACGVLSCSLICVKSHKQKHNCSGQIDPTTFLRREQLLTPTALNRDYNFLQRIGRDIFLEKKDARAHQIVKPRDQWRAGAKVHSVGKGMSRNRKNRSRWNNVDKFFEWTVEVRKECSVEYVQVGDKTMVSSLPAMLAYPESLQVFLIDVHGARHLLRKDVSFHDAISGKELLEFPTIELAAAPGTDSSTCSSSDSDSDSNDSNSDEADMHSGETGKEQRQLSPELDIYSDSEPEEEASKIDAVSA